ncbi:MAG TPA: SurA N-terminal domain-containing protein, partial [Pyrinomonadaceae bacterium]|nr:SurA N-terminal domain-containing protein [Pyrinomonadaceae bacterium]
MIDTVNFEGVKAIVRNTKFNLAAIALFAFVALALTGCPKPVDTGRPGDNETAATVNGKAITMQEVDRAVKQQAQGQ